MEDRRVVTPNGRKQKVKDIVVRRREVDVSAPRPLRSAAAEMVDDADGLRIVNHDEVVLIDLDFARIQLLKI